MLRILTIALLTTSLNTYAAMCKSDDQAQTECCEFVRVTNLTQATRLQTLDQSACTMSVYHTDSNSSFRRFGFGSDGQVSIFLQPGGNKSKSNSSQSFLIFPFGQQPNINFDGNGKALVKSGSGQAWTFSTQSALPVALEGCSIQIKSNFTLQDSGVKISSCRNHLIAETPVEVGGEYISYPDKTLTLKDPRGGSCTVKNNDLYEYKAEGRSYKDKKGRFFNVKLKYKSNAELARNLKILCPSLDVSMLTNSSSTKARTPPKAEAVRHDN